MLMNVKGLIPPFDKITIAETDVSTNGKIALDISRKDPQRYSHVQIVHKL